MVRDTATPTHTPPTVRPSPPPSPDPRPPSVTALNLGSRLCSAHQQVHGWFHNTGNMVKIMFRTVLGYGESRAPADGSRSPARPGSDERLPDGIEQMRSPYLGAALLKLTLGQAVWFSQEVCSFRFVGSGLPVIRCGTSRF